MSNDNSQIKVSVLVPVYGVENYIERCARSLFEQTMREGIEFIFTDDCTPDNSIAILEKVLNDYPERKPQVRIIHHERNRGLSAARNTGVNLAKGEYILHVDSDDWLEPTMAEKLFIRAKQDYVDIVICGANYIYPNHIEVYNQKNNYEKGNLIKHILYHSIPGFMWGKLISKKIYTFHQDAWSVEGINQGEDFATMPRLIYYADKIAYIHEPLYNYNLTNTGSYTHNISMKSLESMLKADRVLEDFFIEIMGDDVINRMKIRTKLVMIKHGNHLLYKDISKIYQDIPKIVLSKLGISDRFLLKIVGRNNELDRLIAWFINFKLHR